MSKTLGTCIEPSFWIATVRKLWFRSAKLNSLLLVDYAGYRGKGGNVEWDKVSKSENPLINWDVVPTYVDSKGVTVYAKIHQPNGMVKTDLDPWMSFFARAQDDEDDTVSWEDGLLFKRTSLKEAIETFEGEFRSLS